MFKNTVNQLIRAWPNGQSNPDHYQLGKIEVWDFIVDQDLDYCLGNVVKYVCRAGSQAWRVSDG